VQVSREVTYVSAWQAYEELRYLPGGVDDLLSRGNGPVQIDDRIGAYFDVTSPRFGKWQYTLGGYLFQQGVSGYSGWLQFFLSWYATDNLTLRVDLLPQLSDDWLLWERDNLYGAHEAKRLDLDVRLDWIPAPRHELRVKWQWIGIDTDDPIAYRADAGGTLRRSQDTVPAFTVSNLGLQVRYRYELGPLSDLFLVYARGGFDQEFDDRRDVARLFQQSPDVRDADQFLVKFRYRL
jgi:hypothetical protein